MRFAPEPLTGLLSINSKPWSEVHLGPQKLGLTPLHDLRLPAGRHLLRLVNAARGLEKIVPVVIKSDQTLSLLVELGS